MGVSVGGPEKRDWQEGCVKGLHPPELSAISDFPDGPGAHLFLRRAYAILAIYKN